MPRLACLPVLLLAACGTDVPTSRTAALSQDNEAARMAAQEARIDNPATLACIAAVTSPEERAILAEQDAAAEALLQDVVKREDMIRCMVENNVVVYI